MYFQHNEQRRIFVSRRYHTHWAKCRRPTIWIRRNHSDKGSLQRTSGVLQAETTCVSQCWWGVLLWPRLVVVPAYLGIPSISCSSQWTRNSQGIVHRSIVLSTRVAAESYREYTRRSAGKRESANYCDLARFDGWRSKPAAKTTKFFCYCRIIARCPEINQDALPNEAY